MAQEDKGLVLRGMLLLTGIGVMVAIVLGVIFWRTPAPIPEVPSGLSGLAPSPPGWEIRYNATTALARRGSSQVPWNLMREMLDEKQQMRNFQARLPDGREVYDEAAARANMVSALRALAAWHDKQKEKKSIPPELSEIYRLVDQLAESPFPELKAQAEKARATFFRTSSPAPN